MLLALILAVDAVTVVGPVAISKMPSVSLTATSFDITDRVGRALGAVSVSGSVAVTGTFWQATQPVSGTFWQATQPVSGPLTDAQLRALAVAVSGTFWQATQPVSGTFWQATQPVSLASMPSTPVTGTFWQATQPVSGAFWQATQPVSGTFWQATQPVSLASAPLPANAATESGHLANLDSELASTIAAPGATAPLNAVLGGGRDAQGVMRANTTTTSGAVTVYVVNGPNMLLPPCNNVRRSNCR